MILETLYPDFDGLDDEYHFGITLQRVDNHDVMTFQLPITVEIFEMLYSSVRSENLFSGYEIRENEEIADKFFRFMIGDLLGSEDDLYNEEEGFYESPSFLLTPDVDGVPIMPFRTFAAWEDLIYDFNGLSFGGSLRISDYNVYRHLFRDIGWSHNSNFTWVSPISYHAVVHTTPQPGVAGRSLVQVTLVHFVMRERENHTESDTNWYARIQAEYRGGFVAVFNPSIATLNDVHGAHANLSSILDQFQLTIYMPYANQSDSNFFVHRTYDLNVHNHDDRVAPFIAAIPLIPDIGDILSTAISILGSLTASPAPIERRTWSYEHDPEDHETANRGFIRGISVNSHDASLRERGHNLFIRGHIQAQTDRNGQVIDPRVRGVYRFRASTNIGSGRHTVERRSRVATVRANHAVGLQRGGSTPYRIIEVPYGSSVRDVTAAFPAPCRLDEGYLFLGWVRHEPISRNFFSFREALFEDIDIYPHYWRFPEILIWGSTGGNQNISTPNTRGHAIYARGGGNTITLTGGDNLADPGTGNNTIIGSQSSWTDIFVIGRGYGLNTITSSSNNAGIPRGVLMFKDGITPDEVFFVRNGWNLEVIALDGGLPAGADRTVVLAAATNRAVFVDFFRSVRHQITHVSFDNGEVIILDEILALSRILYGTATGDDDIRTWDTSGHTIFGIGGNNTITLTGGDNIVDPGTGNNVIIGSQSSWTDIFVIGRGYGLNQITSNSINANTPRGELEFKDDITPDEVFFVRNGWNLEVIVLNGGLAAGADRTVLLNAATNRVVLVNFFNSQRHQITHVSFDNGEVIILDEILALSRILYGTATGDDEIRTWDTSGHTIFGIGGNNTITLTGGYNIVDPGTGNNVIIGSQTIWTDTFIIGRGYGLNQITSNSSGVSIPRGVLEFKDGITPDEVFFVRNGWNLEVIVLNGGLSAGDDRTVLLNAATNRVVLVNFFNSVRHQITHVSFDNGEVITRDEILALSRILYGTATGNDMISTWDTSGHTIFGIGGNNTITLTGGDNRVDPGTGNNVIIGSQSSWTDTFVIGRGYGLNQITSNSINANIPRGVLEFTDNITPGEVSFIRNGMNLEVIVSDTTDNRVVFVSFFNSVRHQITHISFDNGAVITREEILAQVPASTREELYNYYEYEYESQPYDYYSSEYTITQ